VPRSSFFLYVGSPCLPPRGKTFFLSFFLDGIHFAPAADHVFLFMLVICSFAFFALWSRRRSVLDYWLTVVALALMSEIALSLAGSARFSLGFYANRIFSLVTSAIIG